ncbi:MAG TPA: class I SAM-dependent methyltransferase [Vicinamibacterales bacterium]|nr:class I SAM-dependent methyltransferase [Vicinamibacterales bacterium]
MKRSTGSGGWDEYAPFYDWENQRTVGRRDIAFWRRFAAGAGGRALELGTGTGRVLVPLMRDAEAARSRAAVVGVDLSDAMLRRARARTRRARLPLRFARADIRALPYRGSSFAAVMAPYGIIQSLTSDADLDAALAEAARVLKKGGRLAIDLVPDLPAWSEYANRQSLKGRRTNGALVTLVESVRQDRRRRLTIFDQEFTERRGRARVVRRFSLTFRTLPVPEMAARIERAGFRMEAALGDYDGRPWDLRADVWILIARKR